MSHPIGPATVLTVPPRLLARLLLLVSATGLAVPAAAQAPAPRPLPPVRTAAEADVILPARYRPGFRGGLSRRTTQKRTPTSESAKPTDSTRPTTGSGPGRPAPATAPETQRTLAGRLRRFLSRQQKRPSDVRPQAPSAPTAPSRTVATRPSRRPTSAVPTFVPVDLDAPTGGPDFTANAARRPEAPARTAAAADFVAVDLSTPETNRTSRAEPTVTPAAASGGRTKREPTLLDLIAEKGPRTTAPTRKTGRPDSAETPFEAVEFDFDAEPATKTARKAVLPPPAVANAAPSRTRDRDTAPTTVPVAAAEPARRRGGRSLFGMLRRRIRGESEAAPAVADTAVVPQPPPFVVPKNLKPLTPRLDDSFVADAGPATSEAFLADAAPVAVDDDFKFDFEPVLELNTPTAEPEAEPAAVAARPQPSPAPTPIEQADPNEKLDRVDLDDLFANLEGAGGAEGTATPPKVAAETVEAPQSDDAILDELLSDAVIADGRPSTDGARTVDDSETDAAGVIDLPLGSLDVQTAEADDAGGAKADSPAGPRVAIAPRPASDDRTAAKAATPEETAGERLPVIAARTSPEPSGPEPVAEEELDLFVELDDVEPSAPETEDARIAATEPAEAPAESADATFDEFAALEFDAPQPESDLIPDDDVPGRARIPDAERAPRVAATPKELTAEQRLATLTPEESYRQRLLRRLEERSGLGGFQGFCPVVLRDARDLIDAKPDHVSIFEAVAYEFSTAEARRRFRDDPTRYAPVNGGHDVVLTAAGEVSTQGTLLHAAWYHDRLYLFRNPESLRIFRADPSRFEMRD